MDPDLILLIVYGAVALLISALCSLLEAVLLSVTPSHLMVLEEQGSRAGARLADLKEDIDRPLAAILGLNTVAHTVGAAGVGAQAGRVWGDASLVVVSAVLTVLILVLSEIVPKTLGAAHWRRLSPVVGAILPPLVTVMAPLVLLARGITAVVAPGGLEGDRVTREEVGALARAGASQGILHEKESRILSNLLRLADHDTREVMTPADEVFWLEPTLTVGEVVRHADAIPYTRIPLRPATPDARPTGYVLRDDVLLCGARDQLDRPLSQLSRPLRSIAADAQLTTLVDNLATNTSHMTLVLDDAGVPQGLVTLEDLLETLLGQEIADEIDPPEGKLDSGLVRAVGSTKRAKRLPVETQRWKVGGAPVEDAPQPPAD